MKYAVTFTFEADNDDHAKALGAAATDAVNMIVLDGEDLSKSASGRFKYDSIERADYSVPIWRKVT